jgi:probable phosphoglycerate mutase
VDEVEIVLIRHGRTEANASRRIVGAMDVPLDEVGEAQARALAAAWGWGRWDVVVSSPLSRARQTAAALDPAPRVIGDLCEMHQGVLEGLPFGDAVALHGEVFRALAADPEGAVIPGGESMGQVRDRALRVIDGLAAERPGQRVVVVTHLMVVASLACHAAGAPLARWREFAVGNAEARRLVGRSGAWRLLA